MNLADLKQKLMAAARAESPSDRVPYAFEKRIMARLVGQPALDHWALWSRALWRAVAPCMAIMLLLAAWSFFAPAANAPAAKGPANDLSQEFDNTVLAAVDQETATETW